MFVVHILSCVPSNVAYLESPKKKNASNNLPDLVSNELYVRMLVSGDMVQCQPLGSRDFVVYLSSISLAPDPLLVRVI